MGIPSARFKRCWKIFFRDQVSESVAEMGLLDLDNGATVEPRKKRHGEFWADNQIYSDPVSLFVSLFAFL
jgi:hypothetical protein